jgi:hypothetical protein
MLQPEPDASGQSRKTTAQETAKTAHLCGIFRQGSTYPERFDLTYKEEVAGSNPASPTTMVEPEYLPLGSARTTITSTSFSRTTCCARVTGGEAVLATP